MATKYEEVISQLTSLGYTVRSREGANHIVEVFRKKRHKNPFAIINTRSSDIELVNFEPKMSWAEWQMIASAIFQYRAVD